jgi:predicted RNA-binding Zn-ribbon protein involved in translation (DUF1610 family)
MRKIEKRKRISMVEQELEFAIESTLKERELNRRDLLEHFSECPLCHAVIIKCPWCKRSIPFSYQCPECKKVLPLETLITQLSESLARKEQR